MRVGYQRAFKGIEEDISSGSRKSSILFFRAVLRCYKLLPTWLACGS